MATSGTIQSSIQSGHYTLRVVWERTAYSIENNTSTVKVTVYLDNDWNLSIGSRSGNTLTVNGTSYTFTSPSISSKGTHTLYTKTGIVISHASDGKKSFSISCSYKIQATISGTYYGTMSTSGTATLETIPRATMPTLSAASAEIGNSITISTSGRASSSFTHTLSYSFGTKKGTIATGVTTSASWAIPASLASEIPNSTSAACTITCVTYSGSTQVGTKTVSLTLKVKASCIPTVSFTVAEANSTVSSKGFSVYIQSLSKLLIKSTGAGSYGSTIKSYQVTAAGSTYTGSSITTNTLSTSGSITITVKVTDSRGRTGTASKSITVVKYAKPKIASLAVHRCLSDGTLDDEGESCKIDLNASITNISGNAYNFYIDYSKAGNSSVTTQKISATGYTFNSSIIINGFDGNTAYNITARAVDSFYNDKSTVPLSTAATLIDFHSSGKGIAIGKVAEKADVADFGFPLKLSAGYEAISILSGANLNDYVTPGAYAGINTGLLNSTGETGKPFILEVLPTGNNGIIHRLTVISSTGATVDTRTYINKVWSVWDGDSSWKNLTLENGAKIATISGYPSVAKYKKTGNHVRVKGEIACTMPTSGGLQFATLPAGYRPKKLEYAPSVCSGVRSVRLLARTGGGLLVEWIYDLTNGSQFSGDISWVTIDIDFYVD